MRSRLALFPSLLLLSLTAGPATAVTIVDTIAAGYGSSGSVIGYGTWVRWEQGSQFVVPGSQPLRVDTYEIIASQGKPGFYDEIVLYLMTDAGDQPGSVLETLSLTVPEVGLEGALLAAPSTLQPVLAPGTKYWLVAGGPNATGAGRWVGWVHSQEPFESRLHAVRQDGGAWEIASDRDAEAFRIQGTTVAEPAIAALLLPGAVAALALRRSVRG